MPSTGRNEPCPCGSGRKYKRCCGAAGGALDVAQGLHALDEALAARILHFGETELAAEVREAAATCPFDAHDPLYLPIASTYLIHMARVGGSTLVQAFVDREDLAPREREWLEACGRAWLSAWEVVDVFPGRGLHLRDLLTGEERGVTERLATQGLRPRLAICARVVDAAGVAVLAGCHPRPLDPLAADGVASEARRILRAGKDPITVERLRGEFCGTLLEIWQDAVEQFDRRPPPRLENTDGDPLQDTLDRFRIEPGARREVESALGAIDGFRIESLPDPDATAATFFRAVREKSSVAGMDSVTLGNIEIDALEVRVRTNSERRAGDLRRRIEEACGRLLVHATRERRDPRDMPASAAARRVIEGEAARDPEEEEGHDALVLQFKRKHYASWPDEPVPALDGLTPRQAARRPEARRRLVALLKDFEMSEARERPGRRFDVDELRRELGIGDE